jgi:hypothetical protein
VNQAVDTDTRPARMQLPFEHLNLRINPFGEIARSQRWKLAVVELGDVPEQLEEPRVAVQFVGKHGRGKTTHLLALYEHFKGAPYTKLFPGDKPTFSRADLQFVDSIDLLSIQRRRAVYRTSKSIAFTTHCDLTRELQSAGYKIVTRKIGGADANLVRQVVDSRIEHARRHEGPVPVLPDSQITKLVERYGDDIRGIEWHLYEIFQQLEETGNVEV